MSADFSFITSRIERERNVIKNKIKKKSIHKIFQKYKINNNLIERNPKLNKYNYTFSIINNYKNYNKFTSQKNLFSHLQNISNINTTKSSKILLTTNNIPHNMALSTISNQKKRKNKLSKIQLSSKCKIHKKKSSLAGRNSYNSYKNYFFDDDLKKSLLCKMDKTTKREKTIDFINNIKIIRKGNFIKNIYHTKKKDLEFQMIQKRNFMDLTKISFIKSQKLLESFNSSLNSYLRYLANVKQKEKNILRNILIKKKELNNNLDGLNKKIKQLKFSILELKKLKAFLIEVKFAAPKLENINDEDLKKYGVIRYKTETNSSKINSTFPEVKKNEMIYFFDKNLNISYNSISNPPIFNSVNEFIIAFKSLREKIIFNIGNSINNEEDKISLMKELEYTEKLININFSNDNINEYYYNHKLLFLRKQNLFLTNKIHELRKNENLDDNYNKIVVKNILKILSNPELDIKINDIIIKKYGFTGISEAISCLNNDNNKNNNKFFEMNKQKSFSMYILKIFEIVIENIFISNDSYKNEDRENYRSVKKQKEKEKILLKFQMLKTKKNFKLQEKIEKMIKKNDIMTFISKRLKRLGTEEQNKKINVFSSKKNKIIPKIKNKLTYEDIEY